MTFPLFNFLKRIPESFRPIFVQAVIRENYNRSLICLGFGLVFHLALLMLSWQHYYNDLFIKQPIYWWLFLCDMAWWPLLLAGIELVRKRNAILNGSYPAKRLEILISIIFVLGVSFSLWRAVLNFHLRHGMGFYLVFIFCVNLFVLPPRTSLAVLLSGCSIMLLTVFSQYDLSGIENQQWVIYTLTATFVGLFLSMNQYINLARAFFYRHEIETQTQQITEQAAMLAAKNQIIEADKERLNIALEHADRQLATFTLRLVERQTMLTDIKTDLKSIQVGTPEAPQQKKKLLHKIEVNMEGENDWTLFREQFERAHPAFFTEVLAEIPSLNANELRFLALTKMNLDTKDIAQILGISPQSVRIARYRLRKRLNLPPDQDIKMFVQRF